ncbi:hypothetical protein QN277_008737 [Acacia crassicarpa]|uniref:Uncharacterized protein n=1 Tax=Acacia crassicarpa TaxID=499986 RepID=A0AAE1JMF8_9FABA|nr:hypothetical protein QN277_008737 [Acacia crassicarpa]
MVLNALGLVALFVCLVVQYFMVQKCSNKKRKPTVFEDFSVNLENEEFDDLSHGAQSESSKRTRRVGANEERGTSSDGVLIVKQMQAIVSAMREGNLVFRDRYEPQISWEDTFKLIRESACDEDKISKIYCFLMNDVSKLRAMIQCPPPMRKQVIMKMVFDA